MSTSHPREKTITPDTTIYKIMDFDGCFSGLAMLQNPWYRKRFIEGFGYSDEVVGNDLWAEFIESSRFGITLGEQLADPSVGNITIVSGSSRISLRLDMTNRVNNYDEKRAGNMDTGSAFVFFKDFSNFLNQHFKTDKFSFNSRTVYDIRNKIPPGTHVDKIFTDEFPIGYPVDFVESKAELEEYLELLKKVIPVDPGYDYSKISMLYSQIHSLASERRNENIICEFYEDRPEICNALFAAFQKHPELIPSNVELKIFHFNLSDAKPRKKITKGGEGDVMETLISAVPEMNSFSPDLLSLSIQGEGQFNPDYAEDTLILHDRIVKNGLSHKVLKNNKIIPFPTDSIESAIAEFSSILDKKAPPTSDSNLSHDDKAESDVSLTSADQSETSSSSDSKDSTNDDDKIWADFDSNNEVSSVNEEVKAYENPSIPEPFHKKDTQTTDPFFIERLQLRVKAEIESYFLIDRSFLKNIFLTHKNDANHLVQKVVVERPNKAQMFQDIAIALLNEWDKALKKYENKFSKVANKNQAILNFIDQREDTYYYHVLKSLQLIAKAYPVYQKEFSIFGVIPELEKLKEFLPEDNSEQSEKMKFK
ncbi:MAG: hypothetical protein ABI597_13390 [Gammaproteobacteria bacterium]